MKVEPVGDYRSKWGEGPIWWDDELIYVDIEQHKIIQFNPYTGSEKITDVGERIGTVVPRDTGGYVIAGDNGLSFINQNYEKVSIVDPESNKPDNRFNDGKCSPDGHFFAGTISLIKQTGDARLYKLDKNGDFSEVFGPVTNSNGIAWSINGDRMYYIDTPRQEVLAFDYADGNLSNLTSVVDTSHISASPDGMTIDENGNLWIAFCHGGCVICFDPTSGRQLRKIDIPCLETTACTFGGKNLDELFITTGVHKSEIEAHAGLVFRIQDIGVKGTSAFAYQG